ncbi:alpha-beta hydrolase superfamily lysophospholipase [Bradyrhizobium sp. AZCC 2262]
MRVDRPIAGKSTWRGDDAIVSTPAIAAFARHLPAGSHRLIAGAKHEILQEDDRYRAQLWAAFDAFMPG